MCRNIRTLYNYDPSSTACDIEAAALQYVRKVSGYRKPAAVNKAAFEQAVVEVADATARLLNDLQTSVPARDCAAEIAKARERNAKRLGAS